MPEIYLGRWKFQKFGINFVNDGKGLLREHVEALKGKYLSRKMPTSSEAKKTRDSEFSLINRAGRQRVN